MRVEQIIEKQLSFDVIDVDGTTPVELTPSPPTFLRTGVVLHNNSAVDLWVVPINEGESAPTISTDRRLFTVSPGGTIAPNYGSGIRLYGLLASATTGKVTVAEVQS